MTYEPEELQQLAEIRLSDAKALLATGENYTGAYYLVGYAVECALKAVIAKNQGLSPYPSYIKESDLRQKYYTYNLQELVQTAGLQIELDRRRGADIAFQDFWTKVIQWSEVSRYTVVVPRIEAEEMVTAIEDEEHGALKWIKSYW